MSGTFLYLAIVAIWVCVLVPRWVRRTHAVTEDAGDSIPVPDTAGADDDLTDTLPGIRIDGLALATAAAGVALSTSQSPPAARPALSRSRMLQARRRLLTTLLTLAAVAVACTTAGVARWWICVPPAGMLGMYLLLLREVALADAENARQRQEAIAARAERRRAREAWAAARDPEPTAEIIDISARVRDQLYDQYADATVRAVGD